MYSLTNNSPSAGFIAWTNVNIAYKGVSYSIADGSTNYKYVYWRAASPATFYGADTYPTLNPDDAMVFLNKNGIGLSVPSATILDGSLIVPESILANAIAANVITADKIATGAITADELAAGAVIAGKVAANAITTGTIAADAVGAGVIAANVITGDRLVIDAITAREIAAATITATEIAANTITAANMLAGTITAASGIIADAAITSAKIADAAITNAKIDRATANKLVIIDADIATATITSAKIASLSAVKITAGRLSSVNGLTYFDLDTGTISTPGLVGAGGFTNTAALPAMPSALTFPANFPGMAVKAFYGLSDQKDLLTVWYQERAAVGWPESTRFSWHGTLYLGAPNYGLLIGTIVTATDVNGNATATDSGNFSYDSFKPATTNLYNLGSAALSWNDIFMNGVLQFKAGVNHFINFGNTDQGIVGTSAGNTYLCAKSAGGTIYLSPYGNNSTVGRAELDTSGRITLAGNAVALGLSTSWGATSGVGTGAFNALLGGTGGATWLLAGTQAGVFRYGIQALNDGGTIRFYSGINYFALAGSTLSASAIVSDLFTGPLIARHIDGLGPSGDVFVNYVSAGNIYLCKPTSVTGLLTASSLKCDGSTNHGYFGPSPWGWGASANVYPTLYSGSQDRWVMVTNPHIPYLQNGLNGFTGTSCGSGLTLAGDPNATMFWHVGIGRNGHGTDVFSIGRMETSFLNFNSSGVARFSNYVYGNIFNSNFQLDNGLPASGYWFDYNNDGFHRRKSLANVKAEILSTSRSEWSGSITANARINFASAGLLNFSPCTEGGQFVAIMTGTAAAGQYARTCYNNTTGNSYSYYLSWNYVN